MPLSLSGVFFFQTRWEGEQDLEVRLVGFSEAILLSQGSGFTKSTAVKHNYVNSSS